VYNLSIGSRATTLWLALAIFSIVMDVILFQPMKIWLRWICINSWVARDVRTILNAMSKRYVGIIQRKAGVMRDANSLVQHFNPACRAARQFPHLPISRFLLSLNDYDAPHFNNTAMPMKLKRGWAWWHALSVLGVSTFLSITTLLWYPLGDVIAELFMVTALEIVFVVLYYISTGSIVVAVLIAMALVSLPFIREWYINILRRRKKRKMEKLMQDESFLQYHLGGDKQRAGVTKDEYLADEHLGAMGGRIDDTAQFKSKFKPTKGEITEKYNPNDSLVVPGNDEVQLYEQRSTVDQSLTQSQVTNSQVSFGGLPHTSGSGLVVANMEETQAQIGFSQAVKKYGGGGAFGASRPLKPLPPITDRPANQAQVADQIAQLEKNITLNLESIIKESIEKSTLHAKRKAARRKQVRASGKVAPGTDAAGGDGGELDDGPEGNIKIRTPNKHSGKRGSSARGSRRRDKNSDSASGPGLSARRHEDDNESAERAGSGKLLDADNNHVDFLKGFNSNSEVSDGGSPKSSKKIRIGGSDKYQERDKTTGQGEEQDVDDDDSSGSEMKGYVSPEMRHSNKMLGRREKEKPHAGILEPGGHPGHRVPPGGRLKPIDMDSQKPKFGEDPDLIEIRPKHNPKPVIDSQFPDWH